MEMVFFFLIIGRKSVLVNKVNIAAHSKLCEILKTISPLKYLDIHIVSSAIAWAKTGLHYLKL